MKINRSIVNFLAGAFLLQIISCSSEVVNQEPMVNYTELKKSGEIKITDLNKALKLDQNNAGLYAKRARLFLQENKLENALTDIEKAIILNGNQPDYYFWKAVILRDLGRTTLALNTASEAEKLGQKDQNLFLLESELLIKKNKYLAALEKVTLALKEEPESEYGLFYKGIVRAALGDTASAILLYRRAIRTAPEFAHPYFHLASIHVAQKNYEEAGSYLKAGELIEPTNAFLWYQRGLQFKGLKQPDSAYQSFSKASTLDPDMYLANYQMAFIDYKKRNYQGAAINLEKIKTGLGNLDFAQEVLAESYEKSGRYKKAIAIYNQVLRRKPNDVKSLWGVRRSVWGIRKMERDSLRNARNNFYLIQDTTNS